MSDVIVPRHDTPPQGEPHTNSTTEFDPYILRADLTDRELLVIFVESLSDYTFIDFIADAVWDADADEFPVLNAQLHILREALRLAKLRTADAGQEGGE